MKRELQGQYVTISTVGDWPSLDGRYLYSLPYCRISARSAGKFPEYRYNLLFFLVTWLGDSSCL